MNLFLNGLANVGVGGERRGEGEEVEKEEKEKKEQEKVLAFAASMLG